MGNKYQAYRSLDYTAARREPGLEPLRRRLREHGPRRARPKPFDGARAGRRPAAGAHRLRQHLLLRHQGASSRAAAHPKLYNRDMRKEPTRLGHEVSLTVVKVGQEPGGEIPPGPAPGRAAGHLPAGQEHRLRLHRPGRPDPVPPDRPGSAGDGRRRLPAAGGRRHGLRRVLPAGALGLRHGRPTPSAGASRRRRAAACGSSARPGDATAFYLLRWPSSPPPSCSPMSRPPSSGWPKATGAQVIERNGLARRRLRRP